MRASRGIARSQRSRGIHALRQRRRQDPKVVKMQKLEAKVIELSKLVVDTQSSAAGAARTVSIYSQKIADLEAQKADHEAQTALADRGNINQSFQPEESAPNLSKLNLDGKTYKKLPSYMAQPENANMSGTSYIE